MFVSLLSTYLPMLALAYVLYLSADQFYSLTHPLRDIDLSEYKDNQLIGCSWKSKQPYDLYIFVSTSSSYRDIDVDMLGLGVEDSSSSSSSSSNYLLVRRGGLIFNESLPEMDFFVNISKTIGNDNDVIHIESSDKIWTVINKNSSREDIFIKTLLCRPNAMLSDVHNVSSIASLVSSAQCLYDRVKLLKFDVIPKSFQNRHLLRDIPQLADYFPTTEEELVLTKMSPETIIRYWKPEVMIRLVTDSSRYPKDYLPLALEPLLVKSKQRRGSIRYSYRPPLFVDEVGLTSDKYLPLNTSISSLPIKISFSSISLQRWLFMQHMHRSLAEQKGLGFNDKDIDDVRRLISGTSIYYLSITFLASFLHLIFELLSLKSDIQFWKNTNSLVGLSFKQLCIDLISQIVICFYLFENDSSLLVLVPTAIGVLIQLWKINKVYRKKLLYATASDRESGSTVTAIDSHRQLILANDRLNTLTQQADQLALSYMLTLFVPLIIGVSAKSLIYEKHKSWYSFFINTATGFVYSSGFAFMFPQLYINYKLKSVSHLPWAFLFYKFINTFIDDLFAFIIKMPMMHRLSCFRDDVVFIVYLYQRHIYSVDQSRPFEK